MPSGSSTTVESSGSSVTCSGTAITSDSGGASTEPFCNHDGSCGVFGSDSDASLTTAGSVAGSSFARRTTGRDFAGVGSGLFD